MTQAKKEKIKIFQVVSLGENLLSEDIADILRKELTLNPKKPEVYFTVTERLEENIEIKG